MTFTIRQARTHAGMTQGEMAKALKIDRGTYARLEKNADRATLKQIAQIALLTGIPAADIFSGENSTFVES